MSRYLTIFILLIGNWPATAQTSVAHSELPQPIAAQRRATTGKLPLAEVVAKTLGKNPLLEVRRESVLAASAGEAEAAAAFDPVLGASLRGASTRQASAASELDGSARPENENAQASATLTKPTRDGSTLGLEWDAVDRRDSNSSFSRLNPSYDAALRVTLRKPLMKGSGAEVLVPEQMARLETLRQSGQWRAEIESVLRDLEKTYWEIETRAQAVEIRRQGREVSKLILDETLARGATRVEILEARANLVRDEAGVAVAEKDHKDTLDKLFLVSGMLCAEDPGAIQLDPMPAAEGPVPDAVDVYLDALRDGAAAKIEEYALAMVETQRDRARFGLRPTLDLTASAGLLARDSSLNAANSALADADGRYYQAGIEWSMPWDLRAEKAQLANAESRVNQEKSRIEASRLALFGNVRELTRRVSLGLELLESARSAVELNQARFEEQRALRSAGQAILRDVLEAQAALQESRLAELRARLEVIAARLDIEYARGRLPARHHIELSPPDLQTRQPT